METFQESTQQRSVKHKVITLKYCFLIFITMQVINVISGYLLFTSAILVLFITKLKKINIISLVALLPIIVKENLYYICPYFCNIQSRDPEGPKFTGSRIPGFKIMSGIAITNPNPWKKCHNKRIKFI